MTQTQEDIVVLQQKIQAKLEKVELLDSMIEFYERKSLETRMAIAEEDRRISELESQIVQRG